MAQRRAQNPVQRAARLRQLHIGVGRKLLQPDPAQRSARLVLADTGCDNQLFPRAGHGNVQHAELFRDRLAAERQFDRVAGKGGVLHFFVKVAQA